MKEILESGSPCTLAMDSTCIVAKNERIQSDLMLKELSLAVFSCGTYQASRQIRHAISNCEAAADLENRSDQHCDYNHPRNLTPRPITYSPQITNLQSPS